MTVASSATESLCEAAARAITDSKAAVVIGYGADGGSAFRVPVFVRTSDDAAGLVFDDLCLPNLAVYLTKSEVRAMGKLAVVVKGCDLRAVNVLLRENVIDRKEVVLIGVRCGGVGRPRLAKCAACEMHEPQGCDVVVGEPVTPEAGGNGQYAAVDEIEKMTAQQRWEYWQRQLGKCIRCHACRQVCPLCYCKRCIVEKSTPQWVETSPHLRGNVAWNVARALHLTGRCVGCGECERVCPMNIPLGTLNLKMARMMEEWYKFRSGMAADENAPFTSWAADDREEDVL